ncbi:hypothetical protein ILYODFUR_011309 [Ilyodon furcidens]|uniref:Uncharacterized protein n=1 Tax=Ilyodon furcidens TaxID=33524 RepID=A0ABV0UT90_9TELE
MNCRHKCRHWCLYCLFFIKFLKNAILPHFQYDVMLGKWMEMAPNTCPFMQKLSDILSSTVYFSRSVLVSILKCQQLTGSSGERSLDTDQSPFNTIGSHKITVLKSCTASCNICCCCCYTDGMPCVGRRHKCQSCLLRENFSMDLDICLYISLYHQCNQDSVDQFTSLHY